ncbi:MAG TPA: aminotransferase class V-fold PLP-dependent enzyme, partial [Thermoanaerobaculia bacterium]|nr:aminotransferase class V-fold PLP-dependent enzyme [Thermoanaerobaculia bacterium]
MSFDFSPASLDREFPVRKNLVYMNHAAVAPLPRRVADAMIAHDENARDRGAADWRQAFGDVEKTRSRAARFLGATPDEIAFLPNTSWAINLVALAFPWRPGDNVVTSDLEFPSNFYPWRALERRGIECRVAKNRGGRITLEDVAARVDARTSVVAVSWVAFHNGWVFPVEELAAFCRERGILLVVDAIQGLGLLPLDARRTGISVLAADAHKWLYGPEACTLFYVAEEARDRVPAIVSGWWSVKTEGHYLEYRGAPYRSARRYEPGTLPIDHIRGLAASLALLEEIGSATVRERVLGLVRALAEGLSARGWRIATPEPFASGILAAVPPRGEAHEWAKAL